MSEPDAKRAKCDVLQDYEAFGGEINIPEPFPRNEVIYLEPQGKRNQYVLRFKIVCFATDLLDPLGWTNAKSDTICCAVIYSMLWNPTCHDSTCLHTTEYDLHTPFSGVSSYTTTRTLNRFSLKKKLEVATNKWYPLTKFELYGELKIIYRVFVHQLQRNVSKDIPHVKSFQDDYLTDFKLVSEDGESVNIHRILFASLSATFRTMLQGEWQETANNSYLVQGADIETLQDFKEYLYKGYVKERNALELLKVAEPLLMEDLKLKSLRRVCDTISTDNVYDLMMQAMQYGWLPLQEACIRHIEENAERVILKIKSTVDTATEKPNSPIDHA